MAWTVTSVGKSQTAGATRDNQFLKATESLDLISGASTDVSSSVIDFIPAGKDFTVLVSAENLASYVDVDVHAAATRDGTFTVLKADLITSVDNNVKVASYSVSTNGEAPFYKLVLDPITNMTSDSVQVNVLFHKKDRDVV